MMKNKFSVLLGATIASFILFSCEKEEPEDQGDTCKPVVYIDDDIDAPTTWDSSSVYIIREWPFDVNSTLTIDPGTVVKFEDNKYMTVSSQGSLIANGTKPHPIIFTSVHDDAHGCDDNANGLTTVPAAGDWAKIIVQANNCSFNYCEFYYSGNAAGINNISALEVRSDQLITITNCIFAYGIGGFSGVYYTGVLDARDAVSSSTITGNIFYGNTLPLSVNPSVALGTSNTFFNPDDVTEGNTMNAIFMHGLDPDASIVLDETEVPFVIEGTIYVEHPMIVGENVIVKITAGAELNIKNEYHTLASNGDLTYASSSLFTSFKDDENGGDSNGDGDATTPAIGDWKGIYLPDGVGNIDDWHSDSNILYAEKP